MPAWPEISSSLYGAWRLARGDRDGMNFMNLSIDGFWRSFFAAVLAAPAYLLILLIQHTSMDMEMSWLPDLSSYVLGWICWPLVALGLTRMMGLAHNYIPYIITYNWANLVHISFLLPIALITHGQVLPQGLAAMVGLVATLAVLVYLWWVTRVALGASAGIAIGFVVLDVLLGFLLSHGTDRLFS
jgi:hypothetical protein